MRKLFIIAGLITAPIMVSAQMPASGSDAKSKAILDDLSKTTKTYTSISTEFSYTIENKAKKTSDTKEGKLVSKGDKFKLEIANQTILSDGKTSWTILKEAKEVQVNDVTQNDDAITPTNIYTIYEKGFKSEFVGEETKGGVTLQNIKLYPLDVKKKSYHTIAVSIDKAKKQINTIKVFAKDGNDITYKVKKFVTNAAVPDSQFIFDKKSYPGYEVIDLRE